MKFAGVSILLVSSLIVCACGGGGGGGSGASATTPGQNGASTSQAPPVPQSNYSENISPATLNQSNAVGLTQDVFLASDFVLSNESVLQPVGGPQTFNSTENSANGGTIVIRGVINSDGSGWLENSYTNYQPSEQNGNMTLNGTLIEYLNPAVIGHILSGTIGVNNYSVQEGGTEFIYQGNIVYQDDGSDTANVTIHNQQTGAEFAISGFSIAPTGSGLSTMAGTVADAAFGSVNVATPQPVKPQYGPVQNPFPSVFPAGSTGEVTITGAGNSQAVVEPLNDAFVWLGLDPNGNGVIETGARVDRLTGMIDATVPANSSAMAIPELPSAVTSSGPVSVDGRFSFAISQFITYSWKLLSSPPGSQAQLGQSNTPITTFTPDQPGTYMVQLTVTANGTSDSSEIPVNFAGTSSLIQSSPATVYDVPQNLSASVGQPVTLDGRASLVAQYPFEPTVEQAPFSWTLHTPPGSKATLTNTDMPVTSFTPDVPGIYYAMLAAPGNPTIASTPPSSVSVINVGSQPSFQPASILATTTIFSSHVASAYFSSNGISGPAVLYLTPQQSGPGLLSLAWWPGLAPGKFGAEQTYPLSQYDDGLYTEDLNGDGLTDFIFDSHSQPVTPTTSSGGQVLLSSGPGTYAPTTLAYTQCEGGNGNPEPVGTGQIDGSPAIVLVDECYTTTTRTSALVTYLTNAQGQLQAPVYSPIPEQDLPIGNQFSSIALADLNGDGKTDLVASVTAPGATSGELLVFLGNGDGTFTFSQTLSVPGTLFPITLPVAIGDWNGSGYPSIAAPAGASTNQQLELYFGNGTGQFASPITMPLAFYPSALIPVDLNGDGHVDLVTEGIPVGSFTFYNMLGILMNSSSGLQPEQIYPVTSDGINWTTWGDAPYLAAGQSLTGTLQNIFLNLAGAVIDLTPSAQTGEAVQTQNHVVRAATTQATARRSFWQNDPHAFNIPKFNLLLPN